ncbi:hypothetical protein [Marinobacterium weihaiense]|uniref:Uncharacterized protein n=1 Tax=Marinobacterium weihaiense TaxID=2851016 RepID=A0ABS6M9I2_9GAMM|nr:hypothetical protein [Marinobacterium weihaiense]MBV0932937.1 hypothetical protein [Marinobacterium weihaiense]
MLRISRLTLLLLCLPLPRGHRIVPMPEQCWRAVMEHTLLIIDLEATCWEGMKTP